MSRLCLWPFAHAFPPTVHAVRAVQPLAVKSAVLTCFGHLRAIRPLHATATHLRHRYHATDLLSVYTTSFRLMFLSSSLPPSHKFVIPCLIVFPSLLPLLDAPCCSSHSDFGATMFQDLSAVFNCNADSLQPSLLASCFPHHPSTIRSFYHFRRVLLTPLIFHLGRSTSCLS